MKIYFGDNQFLGVNHSSGKGVDYLNKYESAESIAETLKDAWDAGIRDFSFTVNDKTTRAISLVKDECPFNLHPSLPYAHRINNLIMDNGLTGAIFFKVKQFGFFKMISAGIAALFNKNKSIIYLLIRSELEDLPMENVKSIGLLNIATDFILGSNRFDLLHDFYFVVSEEFKCKPLFYTMNFEKLADSLWGEGFSNCAIVFNFNKNSFRTNPTIQSVKKAVSKYQERETIAMSLFSGSKPDEVTDVIKQVPSLSGVLFGSSRKENIAYNYNLISKL